MSRRCLQCKANHADASKFSQCRMCHLATRTSVCEFIDNRAFCPSCATSVQMYNCIGCRSRRSSEHFSERPRRYHSDTTRMCKTCEARDTAIRQKFSRSARKRCSCGKNGHDDKCHITNPRIMRGQIGYDVLDEDESNWLERFPRKRRKA